MTISSSPSHPSIKVIRWIARILGTLWSLTFLIFFIGEEVLGGHSPQSQPLDMNAIIQLSLAGIEIIGLGLAWKMELVGGIITLVAYFIKAIVNPKTLIFPLLLVPFAASLFLLCWWLSRSSHRENPGVTQNG